MKLENSIAVITGAGQGIGRGLAERFKRGGAKHVVVLDTNRQNVEAVAHGIGGHAFVCDVTDAAALTQVIDTVERELGPIDLFCSNAGIGCPDWRWM